MACLVALLWGFLPIFIKVAVTEFSVTFVTAARFTIAFLGLVVILKLRRKPAFGVLRKPPAGAIFAALCLLLNYYTYNIGIRAGTPSHAQVTIQAGGLVLVIYGVLFFGERLLRRQWLGVGVTVFGLVLFGRDFAGHMPSEASPGFASAMIVLSGAIWATYAALQRHVSRAVPAQQLNVLVFGVATAAILPFVEWPSLASLTPELSLLVLFLGLNTLAAYMALAEALQHAPLADVSMIISTNPLLTLAGMLVIGESGLGGLAPERFGVMGYLGAALVVAGVIAVVGRRSATPTATVAE